MRLLVIDDSEDDARLALAVLERAGVRVALASRVEDPDELTAALEDREWDLCLLDWVLPMLTTPEAMRLLRSSRQAHLPCIVWSGRHDAKVAWVSEQVLGAVGFLAKGEMDPRLPQLAREAMSRRAGG